MPQKIDENIIRTCKICGEQFHPTARKQFCCNQIKYIPCVICGNPVEIRCNTRKQPNTCSAECRKILANQQRAKTVSSETRICRWCGKEFTPLTSRDQYCRGIHYQTCVVCGKEFEIDVHSHKKLDKTCSEQCRYKLAMQNRDIDTEQQHLKQTLQNKYGVSNPMQIQGVIDKARQTNLSKYGVDHYSKTHEYKQRVKQTSMKKYGVDHHLKSKDVIDKRTQTVQNLYGVTNVFQCESVQEQSKLTMQAKYGVDNIAKSSEIQQSIKKHNVEKYGVLHPMMLKEYQEKAIKTNIERYGFRLPNQEHIKYIEEWYKFIDNPRKYIEQHYTTYPRSAELADYFGVHPSTIDEHLKANNATDCISRAISLMENEIKDFIASCVPGIKIISNDKTIIHPLELDIYLPDYQLAIECNPTATHNSSCANPWGGPAKSHSYHMNKTDCCYRQGIKLFHIFGYEWTHKKNIIKSMIANLLKCNQTIIYARTCNIEPVDSKTAMRFLDDNHRQGGIITPVSYGLYYNGELTAVMSFMHQRSTMGKSNDVSCWELVRFCTKLNTTIVGGASRLFKRFIVDYDPTCIVSFSDRAHTYGGVYEVLGFKQVCKNRASYVWVDIKTDLAYHRINAQKRNIKRFLKDDDIDLSKTEKDIMIEHGFVQVFDSGTIKWVWTKN